MTEIVSAREENDRIENKGSVDTLLACEMLGEIRAEVNGEGILRLPAN